MSEARDLFIDLLNQRRLLRPGDREAVEILRKAADRWRAQGRFFSSAICMSNAIHAAWGDGDEFNRCFVQAIQDYQSCLKTQPEGSLESLAALRKWRGQIIHLEPTFSSYWRRVLAEELAQRLIGFFGRSDRADSYLVRGFILTTDLDGNWQVSFPEHEVEGTGEVWNGGQLLIEMPSAFRLLLALEDYAGARDITKRCPDAFRTSGLKGWQFAVAGFLSPGEAVDLFSKAADAFAEDVEPSAEEITKRGGWSSINVHLWARYFRARAAVACIIREPDRAQYFFREASQALRGTESGWVNPQVSRFRILVNALLQVIETGAVDADRLRQELIGEQRLFGEGPDDPAIEQFLNSSARVFETLRADPRRALVEGLSPVLDTLSRIRLIGPDIGEAVKPAISKRALDEFFGPIRTWIHRTLEGIKDEKQLRKIILRLEQAHLPRYAQIRHGPLEYGKDIVSVIEIGVRRVLRMWQVKTGDIDTSTWQDSQNGLEQMYLVPLASLQIGEEVHDREGILVCNGHANPYVEPVMQGWLAEQRRAYGRQFEFWHLDRLVKWIIDRHLVNEFRLVLDELGILPEVSGPL